MLFITAIGHDILDFYVRELVTFGGGGVAKKMAIIVLVRPRWNHHNISDFQCIFSDIFVLSLASVIENDEVVKNCLIVPKSRF